MLSAAGRQLVRCRLTTAFAGGVQKDSVAMYNILIFLLSAFAKYTYMSYDKICVKVVPQPQPANYDFVAPSHE